MTFAPTPSAAEEMRATYALLITLAVCGVLAYAYPIRSDSGEPQRVASVLLAICFFPEYVLILVAQNPLRESGGRPNWAVTIVVVIVFWPAYFCLMPTVPTAREVTPDV
jgi:hypothetical protein